MTGAFLGSAPQGVFPLKVGPLPTWGEGMEGLLPNGEKVGQN